MNDDKTKLIDNRKTTLINKNQTKPKDKDKTVLIQPKETSNSDSFISDAFKGVKLHDFVIDTLLSDKGGEAYIFLAKRENDNNLYVAKIYKQDNGSSSVASKINSINSNLVMKILDSGKIRGQYFEIMPYYKNGTLQDNILNLDFNFIKSTFVKELNEALRAIHDIGLVHNDIKPHNIFLTDDRKHIVVGDFGVVNDLNGRDYATKYVGGLSEVFSAPEAYRYSSSKVDYYSFGMTLYHLAFKGDPFSDMSNDRVRGMIANDSIEIDSSIDEEIADLIYMLIKNSPKERIGYDGVNDWLDDHNVYRTKRVSFEKIKKGDIKISHEFNGKLYTSMYELTLAMNDNFDLGYKHFINGFIQDDLDRAYGKQELALELKDIRKQYKDNLDLAYFITLHTLNPDLEFVYNGVNYSDFKGYLNYAQSNYKICRKTVIDMSLFRYLLKDSDEKIKNIIDIIDTMDVSNEIKFDMLLNYFSSNNKIYYEGNIYKGVEEFSNILFTEDLKVRKLEIDDGYELEEFLEYKYGFKSFSRASNLFDRHAEISKTINGYVKMYYVNDFETIEIRTTNDILDYIKSNIDRNKKIVIDSNIVEFIKNNNFLYYYKYEEHKNEKFVDLLKTIRSDDDVSMISKLYLFTSERKKYFLGGNQFEEIQELVDYLAKCSDLEGVSSKILEDKYFYMWLEAKGYNVKEK